MAKKKVIDIDAEFDGIEFDERAINRATGVYKIIENREQNGWREKNKQRYQDLDYKQSWALSIKKAYTNPELRESQRQKGLSLVHTEDSKQKIRKANLGKNRKGEDWISGMAEKQKGNTKRCRPIVTPIGVFISLKEAVESTGIPPNRLRYYTRELPWNKEYYHISKEEYIKLTGKTI